MSSVYPGLTFGPDSLEVAASVKGGQLVEPDGTGKVQPASVDSATVLGAALKDAEPVGSAPTDPINLAWPRPYAPVAWTGDLKVTYSEAATFGALLVSAGSGQVKLYDPAATPANTPDQIVGRCTQPEGVAGAGVVARMRLA